MKTKQIALDVEVACAKPTEAGQDHQAVTRVYNAPELHVVGKAGALVQGNFGYTGSDGTYYWK